MRLLIVGASSFIGYRLFRYLEQLNIYEIYGTFFKNKKDEKLLFFDITDIAQIKKIIDYVSPDTVIWVAGSKNLKYCENSLVFAKNINTYPVENFLNALNDIGLDSHFVFISTDYVFDGQFGNYSDNDKPNPNTNYGLSNYLAEQIIISSGVRFSIVRTSAVMGRGGTFFDWLIEELSTKNKLELYCDKFFTPTPIELFLLNVINIVSNYKVNRIIHVCGNQRMSRFDFGMLLKKNVNSNAKLIPITEESDASLFQKDLSLKPSNTCIQYNTLEWYLIKEIQT